MEPVPAAFALVLDVEVLTGIVLAATFGLFVGAQAGTRRVNAGLIINRQDPLSPLFGVG